MSESPPVPGAVLRPIVGPTPLYPWTMAYPAALRHPGLDLIHESIGHLTTTLGWLDGPTDAWLPPGEDTELPRG